MHDEDPTASYQAHKEGLIREAKSLAEAIHTAAMRPEALGVDERELTPVESTMGNLAILLDAVLDEMAIAIKRDVSGQGESCASA